MVVAALLGAGCAVGQWDLAGDLIRLDQLVGLALGKLAPPVGALVEGAVLFISFEIILFRRERPTT